MYDADGVYVYGASKRISTTKWLYLNYFKALLMLRIMKRATAFIFLVVAAAVCSCNDCHLGNACCNSDATLPCPSEVAPQACPYSVPDVCSNLYSYNNKVCCLYL